MDGAENSNRNGDAQRLEALRYAAAGLNVFPASAAKKPLVAHWRADATCDPAVIEAWFAKWPGADLAWALPANVVVVDIDVKHGKRGYDDFKRFDGSAPEDIATPRSSTPSAGAQLFYAASKPYKNAVAIGGTGLDTRTEGGYVLLPLSGNGRIWLLPLLDDEGHLAPLLCAPPWLELALKKTPLMLAPRTALAQPASSDPWAQRKAQAQLERACARVAAAECGSRDDTRHRECFTIGGIVGRGDLDYATAYDALLEASLVMQARGDAWPDLEKRIARSIESGMERPLPLSETEQWVRKFRATMLERQGART